MEGKIWKEHGISRVKGSKKLGRRLLVQILVRMYIRTYVYNTFVVHEHQL